MYGDDCYNIPKILFQDEFYKGLSPSAIMVYAVLLDKMQEAPSKNWIDENGDVYINYRIAELEKIFGFGNKKMIGIMKSLEECNLIERERVPVFYGYSLPYRTYVREV
ncbi:Replication initiator protein A (RepA) N-terminus [Chlamydia trachomatis]|nr:Replication initiator protein A (RepA) N-terminus [Chlamydia trachomatis]